MTDRELLELAAKAGGYDNYEYVESEYRDGRKVTGHYDSLLEVCINPLTYDGDALRLAVKLGLLIDCDDVLCDVEVVLVMRDRDYDYEYVRMNEPYGNDPCAATRRAIVRAAAEIGKAMP